MKKKVLALVLASAMVFSMAACGSNDAGTTDASNAGTTDKADSSATTTDDSAAYQQSTIKMVINGTLTATEDNGQADFEAQWEAAVSEKMGYAVDLKINQLDHSGYVDGVGRLFAGGDYPDVMIMSADMYAQYVPTGLLWDMTEAYANADFQSRMIHPAINENLKKDGKLLGFAPTYGNGCVTYIKKAWLDALGVNAEDIKTYDDYYAFLKRCHDEDPDGNGVNGDTYGTIAAGFLGNEAPYINYLPEFWQDAYPAIYEKDGQWIDGFNTQETKDALVRMQQAYKDGVIDPESLTASTKIAREKWFSNNQAGSAAAFTYWAGTWYQTLTDNLIKNEVDPELVQLAPIEEVAAVGGYLNREAPVWVIIDDMDGDNTREQEIFDAFIETMMDGDVVQTLWAYGAEDVHWSTKAEEFVTNAGTDKEKKHSYAEGVFHLKQSPNDPNTLWKKNANDPALSICELTNGFVETEGLAVEGNKFFTSNCVDAPISPASETYTAESGTIYDAKIAVVTEVVVNGGDVEAAMQKLYVDVVGKTIEQCLAELNG